MPFGIERMIRERMSRGSDQIPDIEPTPIPQNLNDQWPVVQVNPRFNDQNIRRALPPDMRRAAPLDPAFGQTYWGQNPAPGNWSMFPTQWTFEQPGGAFPGGWVPRAQLADQPQGLGQQRLDMFGGGMEQGLAFGGPGADASIGIPGGGGFGTSFESLGFGAGGGGGGNWSRKIGW